MESTWALGTQALSAVKVTELHEAPQPHLGNGQGSYIVLFLWESELLDIKGLQPKFGKQYSPLTFNDLEVQRFCLFWDYWFSVPDSK